MAMIQPQKEYKNLWIEGEEACDYIPGVSTFTNLTEIITKGILTCFSSDKSLKGRVVSHIRDKSLLRCLVASLPVIGNFLLYLNDKRTRKTLKYIADNICKRLQLPNVNLPTCCALGREMIADIKKQAIDKFKEDLQLLTDEISKIASETKEKLDQISQSGEDQKKQLEDSITALKQENEKIRPFFEQKQAINLPGNKYITAGMSILWKEFTNLLSDEAWWKSYTKLIFLDEAEGLVRDSFKPAFVALLATSQHFCSLWDKLNIDISGLDPTSRWEDGNIYSQVAIYIKNSKAIEKLLNNDQELTIGSVGELIDSIGYLHDLSFGYSLAVLPNGLIVFI